MKRTAALCGVVVVGALGMSLAGLQQGAEPKVIETEKLRDNLYVMKGGGGNTAVFIGSDGVTVVDTKNPGWGTPLLQAIRSVTDKPVVRIINTHTHIDHVSGNVEFPPTVEVVVQQNTKSNMEQMRPVGLTSQPGGPNIFRDNGGRGLPTKTFGDSMSIGAGADQIDLHYYGPAHTSGDTFVVFKALRVMHVGDPFYRRQLPVMDPNNGGSGVQFAPTLARAAAAQAGRVDTIINGHNPTTMTLADLQLFSEFIAEFVKFVQEGKRAGKSVDEIAAAWKTPVRYVGYADSRPQLVRLDVAVVFGETQ